MTCGGLPGREGEVFAVAFGFGARPSGKTCSTVVTLPARSRTLNRTRNESALPASQVLTPMSFTSAASSGTCRQSRAPSN